MVEAQAQPPAEAAILLSSLNPDQRVAVTAADPVLLVVAGPGSGKTRVIAHRIAYAIQVRGLTPQRVVAVTFTNRAAEEMRTRVADLLGGECDARIGTFHWLCQAILRRQAHHIGCPRDFRLLTPRESAAALRQTERALWPDRKTTRGFGSAVSAVKNGLDVGGAARLHRVTPESLSRVLSAYNQQLGRVHAFDLDDLLAKTALLLREHEHVRRRCADAISELLVDEYQDTNPIQQELLGLLRPPTGSLTAVGDEDQAIYGWRQAGTGTVHNFLDRFPGGRVIVLGTVYRCSRHTLRAASTLIAHNRDRSEKNLVSIRPAGKRPLCYAAADARDEAEWIAKQIGDLIARGQCTFDGISVLYRTNVQSRVIEDALVANDIPYAVRSGSRFYDLPEIRTLAAIIRLVLHSDDDDATRSLLRLIPGIGDRRLAHLDALAAERELSLRALLGTCDLSLPGPVQARVAALRDCLESIEDLRRGAVPTVIEAASELVTYLLPERRLAGGSEDDPLDEVQRMLREGDPRELDLQGVLDRLTLSNTSGNENGVSLLSLHAAKGLEFDVVFLAGVEEGLLPHRRSADAAATLDEERRLCYVGMTRARELLFISYAQMRLFGGTAGVGGASRFVGEMGPDNITLRTSRALVHRPRLLRVRPGERVAHPRWRAGTVVKVEGSGRETMVTIDFGSRGTQRLQLCHAPLERVPKEESRVVAG